MPDYRSKKPTNIVKRTYDILSKKYNTMSNKIANATSNKASTINRITRNFPLLFSRRLGGKRKTRKTKKSNRKTRKNRK